MWEVHDEDGPRELVLEPGVVAYLPTGTPHAARAQESLSLHLTIGINQLTWRSLLSLEVGRLLNEVPDEHLPAGYLNDPARLADEVDAHLAALTDAVSKLSSASIAARQMNQFLSDRPSRIAGTLLDRDRFASGLTGATALRRRSAHPCVLVDDGDVVRLLIGDRVLRIPARVRPALEHVATHHELTPSDLPSLNDDSALLLCRRLVREGLLEVVR